FRAGATPEAGKRLLKGEADAEFTLRVFIDVSDPDLFFSAAEFINQSDGIAQGKSGFEQNQCAASVDKNGLRFFLKRAGGRRETVNDEGHVETGPRARARDAFARDRRGSCALRRRPRGWRVKRSNLEDFDGSGTLGTVIAALEFPGLATNL